MEIRFVSRREVVDSLLDQINEGISLSEEQMQMLTDFSNYDDNRS